MAPPGLTDRRESRDDLSAATHGRQRGGQRLTPARPGGSSGVSVAAYSLYDDVATNGNAKEFQRQAATFAQGQRSVGLEGGALKVGASLPITSVSDLVEKVQSIHLALVDAWIASTLPDTF